MNKIKFLLSFFATCILVASSVGSAKAATFNPNHIIDDGVFDNANAMGSASSIDNWLNSNFGSTSCISTSHGFSAPDPIGYNPNQGFIYGGNVSAGQVIYDSAQAYGINPQVLLTTLQKEQSLVDGGAGCSTLRYAAAVGYGCPDGGTTYNYSGVDLYSINGNEVTSVSGTCVNSSLKVGFSQQVIRGAWLLKFGEQRSEGNINWAVIKGNWDNSDDPQSCYGGPMTQGTWQACPSGASTYYDGYTTIDGSSVHMDTGSTATLYWYTPHFSGNQNFFNIFNNWFTSTYVPDFQASYAGQSGYPTLAQYKSSNSYIRYQNTGNRPWYDDVTAPQYQTYPVHLATSNPVNSSSPFSATWPTNNRATGTFAHVYESDGVTLAANQHIAQPGEIAEFDFALTANVSPGNYKQYFQPILEGSQTLWNMGGVAWLGITVQPMTFQASYAGQSGYPTMPQGQSSPAYFKYQNTGNEPWYDNVSAAALHTYPVHLATSNPINVASPFSATWPTNNRATGTFAHVYESDGVTLAPDQHVVQPGEIAEFDFTFTANTSSGYYKQYFQPILEGSTLWDMGGTAWLGVTVN